MPQAILDLGREFVGGAEFLKRREKLAAAVAKPGLEKAGQAPPLAFDFFAVGGVERDQRRLQAAEHVNVGDALAPPPRLDGAEHLIGRAAGITVAARHGRKRFGQRRAETRAENRDHQIAIRGFGNLRLKSVVRRIVAGFPADGADARPPRIFGVEPLDDGVDALALALYVAGRRNEQVEYGFVGHFSFYAPAQYGFLRWRAPMIKRQTGAFGVAS